MSEDWIIRSAEPLRFEPTLEALTKLLPDMAIRPHRSSNWILVVDSDDRARIWIAGSRTDASGPTAGHLTEVSAPGEGPIGPYASPASALAQIVPALAAAVDGSAERLSSAEAPGGDTHPVPTTRPTSQRQLENPADSPADSVLGGSAIVGITHRVVTLSLWLVQQYQSALEQGLRLVVVTPPGAQLSHPAAEMLQETGSLWAVDTGTDFFDGRTGAQLRWEEGEFVESGEAAEQFAPSPDDDWVLVMDGETTHPYDEQVRIGEFAGDLYAAASVEAPAVAGSLEPGEIVFDSAALTAVAQAASPQDTRFVLRGPSSDGILDVWPQPVGIVERVQVVADVGPQPMNESVGDEFVSAALEAGAQVAICGYRKAAKGRRRPSRLVEPVIPVVAAFARSRYPTLDDEQALALAGPTSRLINEPVPALVVHFDPDAEPVGVNDHPVTLMHRLVTALVEHDEHEQLRRAQG